MKTDFYLKLLLTIIAISLAGIAIQMWLPTAEAQTTNNSTGLNRVRICEISETEKEMNFPLGVAVMRPKIFCADVTPDFYLKVQVKDLDALPRNISAQLDNKFNGLTMQIRDLQTDVNRMHKQ